VALLLFIDPLVFILCGVILGGVSWFFYKIVNKHSRIWGEIMQSTQKEVFQTVLESFGAIKEVKVLGKEKFFPDRYYSSMMKNARAKWMHASLSAMPIIVLEIFAVGSIACIIVVLQTRGGSIDSLLPIVALFAVTTIRLMPELSRMISCLQEFRFYSPAVDLVYKSLKFLSANASFSLQGEQLSERRFQLKREISVRNIHYAYPKSKKKAVSGVTLKISRGQSVAFVGPTGSGKTTLVNMILGLLEPSEGKIYVDDQDIFKQIGTWQRNIGYVPQSIYLLDDSIRNNVAFGLKNEEIDDDMVWKALRGAQLDGFISGLAKGLDVIIGENGVRMSGGERQRIGIARALYYRPRILILDEATSALDNETEKKLGHALEELSGDKTLIIIAHRISTVKNCDCIHYMKNGGVVDAGTFDELCAKNSDFRRMAEYGNLDI
jgi:ATP-binding cassette subfamily C protein